MFRISYLIVQEQVESVRKKRNSDSEDEDEVFVQYSPQRIKVCHLRLPLTIFGACLSVSILSRDRLTET